jgi:hypothetical protein
MAFMQQYPVNIALLTNKHVVGISYPRHIEWTLCCVGKSPRQKACGIAKEGG